MAKRKVRYEDAPDIRSKQSFRMMWCEVCGKMEVKVSEDATGAVCWACVQIKVGGPAVKKDTTEKLTVIRKRRVKKTVFERNQEKDAALKKAASKHKKKQRKKKEAANGSRKKA